MASKTVGYAFLASATLLLCAVLSLLLYANAAPRFEAAGERSVIENDARTLVVQEIGLRSGWGVRVEGWVMTYFSRAHGDVDFLVVGQGDADRILAGEAPRLVLHRQPASSGFPAGTTLWPEPGTGALEAVWVAEASRVGAADRAGMKAGVTGGDIEFPLVDPSAGRALPVLVGLTLAAILATLGTGAAWVIRSRSPPAPAPEGATEALVGLVERGRAHLVGMMGVMRLAAGLLVFSGLASWWAFWNLVWTMSASLDLDRYMPWLIVAIMGGALLAYASAWIVWARYYLDLRRELAAWTARASPPTAVDG